jgi:hypothetical protein
MKYALDRTQYRNMRTDELHRRYARLEIDTSAETVEAECGRMFAMQEISTVLDERGALGRLFL